MGPGPTLLAGGHRVSVGEHVDVLDPVDLVLVRDVEIACVLQQGHVFVDVAVVVAATAVEAVLVGLAGALGASSA